MGILSFIGTTLEALDNGAHMLNHVTSAGRTYAKQMDKNAKKEIRLDDAKAAAKRSVEERRIAANNKALEDFDVTHADADIGSAGYRAALEGISEDLFSSDAPVISTPQPKRRQQPKRQPTIKHEDY